MGTQTACEQEARWQHRYTSQPPFWVAVNVSPRQLDDPDLPGHVATAMLGSGLEEGSLRLELTETALLDEGADGLTASSARSASRTRCGRSRG